jgi:hypothetical protein
MRRMRGHDHDPDAMFSYVSPERCAPKDHPLRAIRALVDEVLGDKSREFDRRYAATGRPSIPPERLLRAQLLQIFYSIRCELPPHHRARLDEHQRSAPARPESRRRSKKRHRLGGDEDVSRAAPARRALRPTIRTGGPVRLEATTQWGSGLRGRPSRTAQPYDQPRSPICHFLAA